MKINWKLGLLAFVICSVGLMPALDSAYGKTGQKTNTPTFTDAFSVSSQEDIPTDLAFNTDGTKMFVTGNTGNDVAQKFWEVLDKYNIKKESRTGYSIGIGYPPDWGAHTLNISKGDKTVLQPNVTFHMIAVMQFGDWGVEASESVRVTEKGSELFCNLSRDLHIK